ncbi:MAG: DUF92 domain-containing protein [Candidatus Bathyarchaeota archaeon]
MIIPLDSLNIAAVVVVGLVSLKIKIIDRTGFLAATFVGLSILVFGGLKWFVILLSFHFIAGLFTRYNYSRKMKMEAAEAKGGARGWKNVLSNGVATSLLAICYSRTFNGAFAAGYLGAISTSIADTLATEIGLLNPCEPRLITNLHTKVKAGVSGGVTLLGEVSCMFGSAMIALVALIIGFEGLDIPQIILFNLLIGFLGCNFDSLLGATVQVTFKCQVCGILTEKKIHCELPTEYYKGIRFMDNNLVNFISTIFGALVAIFFYFEIT